MVADWCDDDRAPLRPMSSSTVAEPVATDLMTLCKAINMDQQPPPDTSVYDDLTFKNYCHIDVDEHVEEEKKPLLPEEKHEDTNLPTPKGSKQFAYT